MSPRVSLLLVSLCFLIHLTSGQQSSDWSLTNRLGGELALSDALLSFSGGREIHVQYLKKKIFFENRLAKEVKVIPGQCIGSTSEEFGWNRWRASENEAGQRFVSVTVQRDLLVIVFAQAEGFAIVGSQEVVTCGPLSLDGDKFYTPKDSDLPTFSFVIKRSPNQPTLVMRGVNGDSSSQTNRKSPSETEIRKGGFKLELVLVGDVWIGKNKKELLTSLTSRSDGVDGVLNQMVTETDITIPDAAPNKIVINIPRERSKWFNINSDTRVAFSATQTMTVKQVSPTQDNLNFIITAEQQIPKLLLLYNGGDVKGRIVLTEACLRGKPPPDETASCKFPLKLTLSLIPQGKLVMVDNPTSQADIKEAFNTDDAELANYTKLIYDKTLFNAAETELALHVQLNKLPTLDISVKSTIRFPVPPSVVSNEEPAQLVGEVSPFEIVVHPSPATAVLTFSDPKVAVDGIDERRFWEGGLSANITLDGESWVQDVVMEKLIGNIVGPSTEEEGWQKYKSSILDRTKDAITFPNPQTISLKFLQEVNYELVTKKEQIVVQITADMLASGLALRSFTGQRFTVNWVPPQLVIKGNRIFEEADVWEGNVAFTLTFAGDSWSTRKDFLEKCVGPMMNQWKGSAPKATEKGWEVQSVRDALMKDAFQLPPRRKELDVKWAKNPTYDVMMGEDITVISIAACTKQESEAPQGSPVIRINPQRAKVNVSFVATKTLLPLPQNLVKSIHPKLLLEAPDGTTPMVTSISETRMRNGGISLSLEFTFDRPRPTVKLPERLFERLVSTGTEPTGWNSRKDRLVNVNNIDNSNTSRLLIPLNFYAPYGIAVNEEVLLTLDPIWMDSRESPLDPIAFQIIISPGLVNVRGWTGEKNKPQQSTTSAPNMTLFAKKHFEPTGTITEDQIRQGNVIFNLSLLGDSWMADRTAFQRSFVSGNMRTEPFGIESVQPMLIPGMSFFTFANDPGGFDYLVIRLQAALQYDVARPELVLIALDNRSVSSRLPPSWLLPSGADAPFFPFIVLPSAGKLILSGDVRGVTEKLLRRGPMAIYISLFGETFAPNVSALLRASLVGSDTTSAGFNAQKTELLPLDRIVIQNSTASLLFTPALSYHVSATEYVELRLQPNLFSSGIIPEIVGGATKVGFSIKPAGGELSLTILSPNVTMTKSGSAEEIPTVTESVFLKGFTVQIRLVGDSWHRQTVTNFQQTFLDGLSSRTSVFSEPFGFTSYRIELLQLRKARVRLVDDHTVEIDICGACAPQYDIGTVDELTFSLTKPEFTETMVLPNPSSVDMRVIANAVWIVLKFNELDVQTNPNWPNGRLTTNDFKKVMGVFLNTHESVVVMHPDDDGGKIIQTTTESRARFAFQDPPANAGDPRSAADLLSTLFGLNRTFVSTYLSAPIMYLESEGEPVTLPPATQSPLKAAASVSLSQKVTAGMWAALLAFLIATSSIFLYIGSVRRHQNMPIGPLSGRSKEAKESAQVLNSGVTLLAGDEDAGIILDESKHFASQQGARSRHLAVMKNPLLATTPQEFAPMGVGESLRTHVRQNLLRHRQTIKEQLALGRLPRQVARPAVFGDGPDDEDDHLFSSAKKD